MSPVSRDFFLMVECIHLSLTDRSSSTVNIPIEVCDHRIDIGTSIVVSCQLNFVILADIRNTTDGHKRIANNRNGIRICSSRIFTARDTQYNSSTVNVTCRIIIHSQRAFSEPRATQERMFETISEPFVSKQRGINRITIKVLDRSRYFNLSTVTNQGIACSNVQSGHRDDFIRNSRPYVD